MNDSNNGWIACIDYLPSMAGCSVLVSAVNKFKQRTEFIAFIGYGTDSWYTYDSTKQRGLTYGDNVVSDIWTITHWKQLDTLPRPAKLVRDSDKPKSNKYRCSACGDICYFPHSLSPIPYKFCPNCGKEVENK